MSYPLGHYFHRAQVPASVRPKSLNTTRITVRRVRAVPTKAKIHRANSDPVPFGPRPSAHARGYDRHWQKARLGFLALNPLCVSCLAATPKRFAEATVVDHRIPHRGNQALFWDPANWQALCVGCHTIKTAQGQ